MTSSSTTVVNKRWAKEYDVYIGRPGKYGNPYSHIPSAYATEVGSREEAIQKFRAHAARLLERDPDFFEPLRGKVLACWCKPAACHGDVIVEILERDSNDS